MTGSGRGVARHAEAAELLLHGLNASRQPRLDELPDGHLAQMAGDPLAVRAALMGTAPVPPPGAQPGLPLPCLAALARAPVKEPEAPKPRPPPRSRQKLKAWAGARRRPLVERFVPSALDREQALLPATSQHGLIWLAAALAVVAVLAISLTL